ncbi:MAG: hypothetical protein ACOZF2_02880 [Thermodesulfobacteriota bacterium]
MELWDGGLKSTASTLLVVLGAAVAAPIVLPLLAQITRPVAKAAIHLYLDLAADIQEVVAHHQPRRSKRAGLIPHLLTGGTEELVTAGLEAEAEGSLAETVAAVVVEIL